MNDKLGRKNIEKILYFHSLCVIGNNKYNAVILGRSWRSCGVSGNTAVTTSELAALVAVAPATVKKREFDKIKKPQPESDIME